MEGFSYLLPSVESTPAPSFLVLGQSDLLGAETPQPIPSQPSVIFSNDLRRWLRELGEIGFL
jgi:hypothetical protein